MSASSYSWLGLSPMVWSLVSVVSSFVGLWVAGRAARRQVCGRVRLVMCLLAGLLQFILVLCGLSVLVVHMSPQAQVVTIVVASVGTAVWRFYAMVSAPRVLTRSDSGSLGAAGAVHEGAGA